MAFAAPLFLLGLLAMAIPWILHLLNQHDAPEQSFPSAQFLEQTTAESSRKKKLRYLRLLALRLLFLALLCLLFAQPLLKRVSDLLGADAELHALVVDKSYSMRQRDSWEVASSTVADIIGDVPAGSKLQLFSAGATLDNETEIVSDAASLRQAMTLLEPGYERLHYAELMKQLSDYAETVELPMHVHFISDMQSSAMPARAGELINREFKQLDLYHTLRGNDARQVPHNKESTVPPLMPVDNQAIRAWVKPRDENTFDLMVEIKRFTRYTLFADGEIELVNASGELVGKQSYQVMPNDATTVSFDQISWPQPDAIDQYTVRTVPGDAFAQDDEVIISVRREPQIPIAIVSNASEQLRRQSVDELYLKTALQLDPRNRVTAHPSNNMQLPNDVQIVIYLDYLPVSNSELPELTASLKALRERGVHILYVLSAEGERTESPAEIERVQATHPLGLLVENWQEVRFLAQQPLRIDGDQAALIATGDNNPVIVESSVEDSSDENAPRLLWLNAALNGAGNNFPVSPVFVPFLSNVVDYFVRANAYPAELTVGDGIKLKKSVQLLNPAGEAMLDLADLGKENTQIVTQPGTYTLLESNADIPIHVVVDAAESDLRAAAPMDLQLWARGTTAETGSDGESSTDSADSASESATSSSGLSAGSGSSIASDDSFLALTRWLLPLCLVLLIAEILYANWHLSVRRT